MRRGAFDYLPKPFTPRPDTPGARPASIACADCSFTSKRLEETDSLGGAGGPICKTQEPAMRQAVDVAFQGRADRCDNLACAAKAAQARAFLGARHSRSLDAPPAGPFVTIHCPSLSAELLESELFGHVKGSFTGGLFKTPSVKVAAAEGGTLLLDEIGRPADGRYSPSCCGLLQEKRYERIGETRTRACDVRILAATNPRPAGGHRRGLVP